MPELLADRREAGHRLARRLAELAPSDPVIVALPRGGVPVGAAIAEALGAPLSILAVRKLGAPGNPEYGVGAVAEDGTTVIDREATTALGIDEDELDAIADREQEEVRRQVGLYRGGEAAVDLRGRTPVIVDDGAATGLTVVAAVLAARRRHPLEVIVALPVSSEPALARVREEADRVVCLRAPRPFYGVGNWYRDFGQVGDQEVIDALRAT